MDRSQPLSHQSESDAPLNLGLSVKERAAAYQRPAKPGPSGPKGAVIESGVSVRDRAKTLNSMPTQPAPWSEAAKPAAANQFRANPVIPPPAPSAPAPVQTSTKVDDAAPRLSVKDRINMLQASAKPQGNPFKPAVEVSGGIAEKKAMLAQVPLSSPKAQVAPVARSNLFSDSEESKREEVVRAGRVAEIAGKIQSAAAPAPTQTKTVDIGVSIQEKKQFLQQQFSAAKSESSDRVKADLSGLPSVEARKSLITSSKPTEVRKDPFVVDIGSDLAERKAKIREMMEARAGMGLLGTMPVDSQPAFTGDGIAAESSVQPCTVDKPVIHRNVVRRAAQFDDFE